jgi:hypothetical protein
MKLLNRLAKILSLIRVSPEMLVMLCIGLYLAGAPVLVACLGILRGLGTISLHIVWVLSPLWVPIVFIVTWIVVYTYTVFLFFLFRVIYDKTSKLFGKESHECECGCSCDKKESE